MGNSVGGDVNNDIEIAARSTQNYTGKARSETEDGATLDKPFKLGKLHLADDRVINLC
jgi:hypothetical protein